MRCTQRLIAKYWSTRPAGKACGFVRGSVPNTNDARAGAGLGVVGLGLVLFGRPVAVGRLLHKATLCSTDARSPDVWPFFLQPILTVNDPQHRAYQTGEMRHRCPCADKHRRLPFTRILLLGLAANVDVDVRVRSRCTCILRLGVDVRGRSLSLLEALLAVVVTRVEFPLAAGTGRTRTLMRRGQTRRCACRFRWRGAPWVAIGRGLAGA